METTPIRKRETELNPGRGSARLRANRFAPLQTVDRPKPGKFTRSRRPAGRVRAHARPSFALLDRAFPGPRTKREGRALLTENWQHWNWQQFHIGNMGRVLPVCECCQSPGPIANAPGLPAALRGRAAVPAAAGGLSTKIRHRQWRICFHSASWNGGSLAALPSREGAWLDSVALAPIGSRSARPRDPLAVWARPFVLLSCRPFVDRPRSGGGPPPRSGQGRQDDATTRRRIAPARLRSEGDAFSSSRRPREARNPFLTRSSRGSFLARSSRSPRRNCGGTASGRRPRRV